MSRYKVVGQPWRAKGAVDVSDCRTAEEVMVKAGLDFQVQKCELVAKMPIINPSDETLDKINEDVNNGFAFIKNTDVYRECPNAFATYRTDRNIPLGTVKSKYEVVQNTTAFKFFNDAIGKDKAIWQTAGAFGSGERIFVSAKLPNNIRVKRDIIENYLVFTNSHDGSGSVNILFTPIRIICQNTLNAAIRQADCYLRFRHTSSVHGKILSAQEILGISKQRTNAVQEMLEQLSNITFSDEEVMEYIAKTYLTEAEYNNIKTVDAKEGIKKTIQRYGYILEETGISTRKANIMADTFNYYLDGPGQPEYRGTAYGAYNAITGYYSNVANLEGFKRMDSLLYGNASRVTSNALSLMFE